jgi:hypothetical protein
MKTYHLLGVLKEDVNKFLDLRFSHPKKHKKISSIIDKNMILNSEELHSNFLSMIITQIPTNQEEISTANANSVVAEKISFH